MGPVPSRKLPPPLAFPMWQLGLEIVSRPFCQLGDLLPVAPEFTTLHIPGYMRLLQCKNLHICLFEVF